ncbi:uncharacterized protein [Ranitomeya imitator]|uniref:uncharacterized protein n=1 Tax=Ranitomeya imitator TaxID=111125 RepID=UPI0037E9287D
MELLIKFNEFTLSELEREIDSIQTTLKKDLTNEAIKKVNEDLEKDFLKWEDDIKTTKAKKFQRDVLDFQNNQVYRWRQKYGRRGRSISRVRNESCSSVTSGEEHDSDVPHTSSLGNTRQTRSSQKQFEQGKGKSSVKRKISPLHQSDDKKKKPGTLEVINLSHHRLTDAQHEVLSLGLTFVPNNPFNYFSAMKDVYLFSRKLILKKLHNKREDESYGLISEVDKEILANLEDLLKEQEPESKDLIALEIRVFLWL